MSIVRALESLFSTFLYEKFRIESETQYAVASLTKALKWERLRISPWLLVPDKAE